MIGTFSPRSCTARTNDARRSDLSTARSGSAARWSTTSSCSLSSTCQPSTASSDPTLEREIVSRTGRRSARVTLASSPIRAPSETGRSAPRARIGRAPPAGREGGPCGEVGRSCAAWQGWDHRILKIAYVSNSAGRDGSQASTATRNLHKPRRPHPSCRVARSTGRRPCPPRTARATSSWRRACRPAPSPSVAPPGTRRGRYPYCRPFFGAKVPRPG